MGSFRTPLHLLPFCKAFGDDVVHRRFNKASAYSVTLAIAFAIVGNEGLIVGDVSVEFFNGSQQFASRCIFIPCIYSSIQYLQQYPVPSLGFLGAGVLRRYYHATDTI